MSNESNHAVVFDCGKRVIFDNEELCPVILSVRNFRLRSGTKEVEKARIEDFRTVLKA